VTLEDRLAHVEDTTAAILRELRDLRAERQHQGGRWGSRAEAARHYAVSVDTIDSWARAGTIRVERRAPPPELRRDRLGRRIDRRRVRVWIAGPPATEQEIEQLAGEARS
jgi:hypothetical protein